MRKYLFHHSNVVKLSTAFPTLKMHRIKYLHYSIPVQLTLNTQEDCPRNTSNESRWTSYTEDIKNAQEKVPRKSGTGNQKSHHWWHCVDSWFAFTCSDITKQQLSAMQTKHYHTHLITQNHTPYRTSSDWSTPWRHTLWTLRFLSLWLGSISTTNCTSTKYTSIGAHKINYLGHVTFLSRPVKVTYTP